MIAAPEISASLGAVFDGFDGYTYTMMGVIAVAAGFMMRSIAWLLTATLGALVVFALAVFARAILGARDASAVARFQWNDLMTLQLRTLAVYALVFAVAIGCAHGLRTLAKN